MSSALQRPRNNKNRQHNSSGRGGYQNSNSYRRETPDPEVPTGCHADHRTAYLMCNIHGTVATVKLANGRLYKGIIQGVSEKGDIALEDAALLDADGSAGPNLPGLIIPKDKVVVIKSNGVDLKGSSSDFTDAGIVSRTNGSSEIPLRDLQPWEDDDAPEVSTRLSLDDHSGSGWDSEAMFKENFQKFQITSSFDENMHEYTTKLPEPGTEAYEAKERFAKEKAAEIERDETYQRRIAKELADNDEDSRFSFVHRPESESPNRTHETHSGRNIQGFSHPRGERDKDEHMRNGNLGHRGQGRGSLQRQNSPYSSAASTSSHHVQSGGRQSMNNHYQQGPPTRNQSHPPRQQPPPSSQHHHHSQQPQHHHQQQQHHLHSQYPPTQQHISQQSLSQHRVPQHQQVVSPTQPPPAQAGKQPLHHTVPSSSSPVSGHQPPAALHQKPGSSPHQQPPPPGLKAGPPAPQPQAINGVSGSQSIRPMNGSTELPPHMKLEENAGIPAPEMPPPAVASLGSQHYQQPQHQQAPSSSSSSSLSMSSLSSTSSSPAAPTVGVAHQQQKSPPTVEAVAGPAPPPSSSAAPHAASVKPTTPSTGPTQTGRVGRGSDASPEEARSKIADLQDFKEKFVLENPRQDDAAETTSSQTSAAPTPASSLPAVSQAPSETASSASSTQLSVSEQATSEASVGDKKPEEPAAATKTFKWNPNAKEFKPKASVEAQSPSPQPRSSPQVHPMITYQAPQHIMMPLAQPHGSYMLNASRKRPTMSLQANVDHLTHQVTGQPLLATTQTTPLMYMAPGYQHILTSPQLMTRMPNSMAMAQGQHPGLEQTAVQSQQQPMFVPAQQQPVPAHLPQPPHPPQPAHGPGPMHQHQHQHQHHPQQQQPQANPAPSPVPQSVTPQSGHYINFAQVSRTSSTQPNMTFMSGGPHYSHGYQNANNASNSGGPQQYSFAPAPAAVAATLAGGGGGGPGQPQTSQNASHQQVVVMPHPNPQAHPGPGGHMQGQHQGQAYATAQGLQFHPQSLMQGPPQLPPNHGPAQGAAPHMLQHSMHAGIHQPVPGSQQGMYMQMPSTPQLFQHQQ